MKIAVIGAGPAGASAAYALGLNDHDVVLLEGDNIIGGRTQCVRKNGFTLDTGAGFVTNFYPRLLSIAHDLEFISEIHEMNRISGLVRKGKLATINVGSPLSFLSFPFLTLFEKLKMAYWMTGLSLKRKRFDLANPDTLRATDSRSIAEAARSELNENIYQTLIRPGIEPFWYFSCEDVSEGLLLALSAHAAGAEFYSFPEGIDTICKHLVENTTVYCDAIVDTISERAGGYRVHYSHERIDKSIDVDQVIVATTASTANAITKDLSEHSVSSSQRAFLQSQQYASNVHACFEISSLPKPPRAGAVFPCDTGIHKLAAISFHRAKTKKYNRKTELVSIYLSNSAAREMMSFPDEELYRECWALAREAHDGLPKEYAPFHLVRRKEAIPIHAVGRYELAAQFNEEQCSKTIRFCGDYLATATIEGAIASGWRASVISQ